MKRYRPLSYQFDFRAGSLRQEIQEDWEPQVKEAWHHNQNQVRESLVHEYGARDLEGKFSRFKARGELPFSVIAFHNQAFPQIRDAYVSGAFYPALTGACALGEWILNHLVLGLRHDFRATKEYKRVQSKESISNWRLAIDTLSAWGGLRTEVASAFEDLRELRNRSIHFRAETLQTVETKAAEAISLLGRVIDLQFGAFGAHPWFCSVPGVVFIKKAYETDPFVKLVYLPNCALVGPNHVLATDPATRQLIVRDETEYEAREISDGEFLELYQKANHARVTQHDV